MPVTNAPSPLSMLLTEARATLGEYLSGGPVFDARLSVQESIDHIAGGILASMGMREISEDLDVRGVAILSVAAIAGLQKIAVQEPTITRLDSALGTLEDLLRRTVVVRNE